MLSLTTERTRAGSLTEYSPHSSYRVARDFASESHVRHKPARRAIRYEISNARTYAIHINARS